MIKTLAQTTDPDLILHPIRSRIVYAVEGRSMTSSQISREVPDVPQASLYRHIKKLQQAGILVVVEEKQVHGTIERVYEVEPTAVMVDPKKLASKKDKSARYFEVFLSCQRRAFSRYVSQDQFDFQADGAKFYSEFAHLTDEEQTTLNHEIRKLIIAAQTNPPGGKRRRRNLTFIALPEPASGDPSTIKGGQRHHKKKGIQP